MNYLLLILSLLFHIVINSQVNYPTPIEDELQSFEIIKPNKVEYYKVDSNGLVNEYPSSITTYIYDSLDNLIVEKSQDTIKLISKLHQYIHEYDSFGRLVKTTDKSYDSETEYTYQNTSIFTERFSEDEGNGYYDYTYDKFGNRSKCIGCDKNECEKLWIKKYNAQNKIIEYVVFSYGKKVGYKEVYEYDNKGKLIHTKILNHDPLGESLYDPFLANVLVDYGFINKNICIERKIDYSENSTSILFLDANQNSNTLTFIFDSNKNATSIIGTNPFTRKSISIKREFIYDSKNRIIQLSKFDNNKLKEVIKYEY